MAYLFYNRRAFSLIELIVVIAIIAILASMLMSSSSVPWSSHQSKIAEMATGEGKTLVATLPAYLNALTGHGVHIVTVNDYRARRDRQWMGPIYKFLGLSVGVIQHDMDYGERQEAYRKAIRIKKEGGLR